MKLCVSRDAACAAVFVAIVVRLFYGLAVEDGAIHNGAWLSALLSTIPAIPLLLCLDRLQTDVGLFGTLLKALLLEILLLDGGAMLAALERSAGFLALDRASGIGIVLPACLLLFWCICRNGDAVGYAAMVFLRLFPALLLLVLLLQIPHFRPHWLTPIFGNGMRDVLRAGADGAGWFVPASALLCVSERKKEGRSPALLSLAGVAVALLILPTLMMFPTTVHSGGWLFRLDGILTNGRAPLYLQLPLIVLWFAGLMHLLLCEGFAAAAVLQRLAPRLNGHVCAALAALGFGLMSTASPFTGLYGTDVAPWLYVACGTLAAILALYAKGGLPKCAG